VLRKQTDRLGILTCKNTQVIRPADHAPEEKHRHSSLGYRSPADYESNHRNNVRQVA
jgi:hypothetical protein